ncbi:MAG: glycosyltransferase family 39 protein, partial [Planctomycetota bacterium]
MGTDGGNGKLKTAGRWLASHRKLVLGLIVGLSILQRVVAFAELSDSPCFHQHKWKHSDMNFFHSWAQEIARGDLLTDQDLHPQHGWHQRCAHEYFREHPEELAALKEAGKIPTADPDKLRWDHEEQFDALSAEMWNRWYGGRQFQQEPLYAYVMALFYGIFGAEMGLIVILQLIAGVLTNVLIYLIARRHFGDVAAVLAALMALLFGPFLMYEMVLLRTSFITFLGLLLIWTTERAMDKGTWRSWLLAGVVSGIAVLLKMIFIVFPMA